MIYKLIRYFKGYLRIRISGSAVERFLNTCSYKKIYLWDITSNQTFYEVNILLRDFKNLKPVIRKTRTKICIVNRSGFPFFIQKYHKRKFLFTGFIFCVLLISYFSTFIWNITITGNQTCTTESILDYLKTMDVEQGMKRKDISCSNVATELRKHFDDIIWVSASLEGSKLYIEIKENIDSITEAENDIQHSSPYDIISNTNCTITKIIVRNGIANIKEGERVQKGDIIISGNIPVLNDTKEIVNYRSVVADADIYGKTNVYYENTSNLNYQQKQMESTYKKEYYIQIGNYRFGIGGIENKYENFTEYSNQLRIGGIYLGFRMVIPYSTIQKQYSVNEIQEILSSDFNYYCKELEKKGVVILENNVKIYTWSDTAKAKGHITVEMPVGQLKKSEIIEIGEPVNGNDGNNN